MSVRSVPGHSCRICGAAALQELPEFAALARVTSDSKPWPAGGRLTVCGGCGALQKLPDAAWLAEIEAIYGAFEIYHQSGGAEQPIYDPAGNASAPRSAWLVEHLVKTLGLGGSGRLLDFGCGNGAALATFAARRPGWALSGSELSDRALPALRRIPGFTELYTCPPGDIPGRFTLITLIHSLEHLIAPVATLAELRGRVAEDGHLFVQVPDCRKTPYDLLVADHLLHFTLETLRLAGERAGYRTVALSDAVVTKELSWIGRPGPAAGANGAAETDASSGPDAAAALDLARRHVGWLAAQVAAAEALAARSPNFGIFGTSISGTWLYGVLRDRVAFFVDEDPGRINRRHMDRPILAPAALPADADVFVPLIPEVAASVVRRLAGRTARFHTPPPSAAAPAGRGAAAQQA